MNYEGISKCLVFLWHSVVIRTLCLTLKIRLKDKILNILGIRSFDKAGFHGLYLMLCISA